jgi:hypothetical protein
VDTPEGFGLGNSKTFNDLRELQKANGGCKGDLFH